MAPQGDISALRFPLISLALGAEPLMRSWLFPATARIFSRDLRLRNKSTNSVCEIGCAGGVRESMAGLT